MLNKPKVNYFIFSCYNGEGEQMEGQLFWSCLDAVQIR